jgi:AraC-like DNA-binding protein
VLVKSLLNAPDLRISAVSCSGGRRPSPEEEVGGSAVVLVRRGVFVRRVEGKVSVADPVAGYVQRPGEVQQIEHPAGGDTCTSVALPDEPAARLAWAGPLMVSPAADLAHRRLLARAASGASPPDLVDLAADLIGALLPPPRAAPRRAVDEVRAALNADPQARLEALAALVGWSPWHLSRTFRRVTGVTINTYRVRLRVRAVLDELADPGAELAALAVRAGFADQAHMTRAVRRELATSPARLRRLFLSGPPGRAHSARALHEHPEDTIPENDGDPGARR